MDKNSFERTQSLSSVQGRKQLRSGLRSSGPRMPPPMISIKLEPVEIAGGISAEQERNEEPTISSEVIARHHNDETSAGQAQEITAKIAGESLEQAQVIAGNIDEPLEQSQGMSDVTGQPSGEPPLLAQRIEQFRMVQRIAARFVEAHQAEEPTMSFEDLTWVLKEAIKSLKFVADQLEFAMESYIRGLSRLWHSSNQSI